MTDADVRPRRPVGVLDPPLPLAAPPADAGERPLRPRRWSPAPRRGWLARFVRGKESDAAWVRPALLALLVGHRRPLHLGPRRQRLGQLLLLRRRAGGHEELEGDVLRLLRLVQLHHRRQAAGLPVADGDLGADLRPQLVEHAGRRRPSRVWPPSAWSTSPCGAGSARRPRSSAGAVVALTPVAAMMFRYNNPDAMLALLLTAATYATMRGLEKAQTKWLVLAGALVGLRLHHQDDAGLPDPPGHGRRLPAGRADGMVAPGLADLPHGRRPSWWPPGGGWPSSR